MKDRGYFCNIKYFNDRTRGEYINVGVMIYSLKNNQLSYNICKERTFKKIRFFYPNINLDTLNHMFDEFELLVKDINSNHLLVKNIEIELNDSLKYSLRIEPFKKIMIDDIEDDLKKLYENFVCNKDELEIWKNAY